MPMRRRAVQRRDARPPVADFPHGLQVFRPRRREVKFLPDEHCAVLFQRDGRLFHQRMGTQPQHRVAMRPRGESRQRQQHRHHVAIRREASRAHAAQRHRLRHNRQRLLPLLFCQRDVRFPANQPPRVHRNLHRAFRCIAAALHHREHRLRQLLLLFLRHERVHLLSWVEI